MIKRYLIKLMVMLWIFQNKVQDIVKKSGYEENLGSNIIFWSADEAIKSAEKIIA